MLVIRLQRTGRENLPSYRIVVTEKARPAKGKFLEILGHYLPAGKQPVFKVEMDKVTQWISKGAIPSNTLARLLKKEGAKNMDRYIQRYVKRKSKNAPEETAEAPAAAAPAPSAPADTPAEASA